MRVRKRSLPMVAVSLFALAGIFGGVNSARAATVTYTGSDVGANVGDPTPNSDSAAASFAAAAALLGPTQSIDFESAPVGSFTTLTVAPGVSISATNSFGSSIANSPSGSPSSVYGFNTTPGGQNYVSMLGGDLAFTFASPVQAFGAYLTGVQLDGETVTFDDGSSQTLAIPNNGSGVTFFGFTDAGTNITGITYHFSPSFGDIVGVDDVKYVNSASAVPLPASVWTGATLLVALGAFAYRRRVLAQTC